MFFRLFSLIACASLVKPSGWNMGSPPLKVTFSEDELRAYFPKKDTTVGDVKRVVFEALDLRQKALDRQKARAEQEKAAKKATPGKVR